MSGRKPSTRICDTCKQRKPWERGYHPNPEQFICADCMDADPENYYARTAGWRRAPRVPPSGADEKSRADF